MVRSHVTACVFPNMRLYSFVHAAAAALVVRSPFLPHTPPTSMPGKPNAGKAAVPAPATPASFVAAAVLSMETPAALAPEEAELGQEVVAAPREAVAVPSTAAIRGKRKAAAAPAKHADTFGARAEPSAVEPSASQPSFAECSSERVVPAKRPRLVPHDKEKTGSCPQLPDDESFVDATDTVLDLIPWARYFACHVHASVLMCFPRAFLSIWHVRHNNM